MSRRAGVATGVALGLALATAVSPAAAQPSAARGFLPRILTNPTHSWTASQSLATRTGVRTGTLSWAATRGVSGGRVVRSASQASGPLAALLRLSRVGTTAVSIPVPSPGTYRVTLLVPRLSTAATSGRVVAEGRTIVNVAGSARTGQLVSFTTVVRDRSLDLRLSAARLALSGVQVASQGTVPATGSTPTAVTVTPVTPTTPLPGVSGGSVPTWPSGAWPGGTNDAASVRAFASMRGRQLDVISTSNRRLHWSDIANDMYGVDRYAGFAARLSIAVPMLPDDRTSTLADVIAGKHDAEFRSLAANLVSRGRGDSILRLGWEFNGDWQPWAAFDTGQFIAAFQHEVTVLRAVDPSVVIDWNGNFGPSQVKHTLASMYPGDAFVDIIGVDAYDRVYFHVKDEASWQDYLHRPDGGLLQWLHFAQSHGKKFSVPEWALYVDAPGGSDNAYYIQKMYSFFKANAASIAYECYFNDAESGVHSSILAPVQNPRSETAYALLYSGRG